MPVPNPPGEYAPPGGSNHAAQFQKGAFCSQLKPPPVARAQVTRSLQQMLSEQDQHRNALKMHAATVDFVLTKEAARPSRLRCNFETYQANPPPAMAGWEMRAKAVLESSASSPTLATAGIAAVGGGGHGGHGDASAAPEPAPGSPEAEVLAARMMNSRYYPHPTLNRGFLKLSGGRAKDWGIDLERAPGVPCPFWEAPRDRFAHIKTLPGSALRVPPKAAKWQQQEAWEDPTNHHGVKIR